MCERYWRLTVWNLRLVRRLSGDRLHKVAAGKWDATPLLGGEASRGWLGKIAGRLRRRLAGQAVRELDIFEIPESIYKEVEEFAPQVIYSNLGSNAVMRLVIELADRLTIPIVPHFMDDWLLTLYHASIFSSILRRTMFERMAAILARSPKRLVIGEAMAKEYTRRYGVEFLPFMNAVEPELFAEQASPPPSRQTLRLVYVGGLHLNRWRSLREIGLALKVLHAEGYQSEALIYSPSRFNDEGKKLDMPPVMHFAGALVPSQIPAVLREADILLHVESFDRISRTYSRYSVSTKIPEYMCAARPILAYGPVELASINYVRDSGAGLAVAF